MTTDGAPLRVVIVGAGPSGLFAADALLKARDDVRVDVFDRLPTPYGLVRYGVAPDHAKIKSVTKAFEKTCRDPRLRFFGNVDIGKDVTVDELRRYAHAVILAVGASSDRSLGVPGEDLAGSLSATEFVAWYNGHPDYVDLNPRLDAPHVAVVGMGNVAVDVARILAKSVDELAVTDIADHAIEALAESRVEEISMLGRRGPAQAKWTTKELRELGELENADLYVDPAELELDAASAEAAESDAMTKRNLGLLADFAAQEPQGKPRKLHVRFFVSPVELHGEGRVERMTVGRNRLEEREGGYLAAVDTGERETLPADLVLRSVGYRGVATPGVPFDARRGVVPNEAGRVVDDDGRAVPGMYVAGWIKRGPSGVIGTNKADAVRTVEALLADPLPEPEDASEAALPAMLASRGVSVVDFEGWLALDRAEVDAGSASGRPRVKVVTVADMLRQAQRPDDS
ncbi:MAG: FAD-dependent oxidoreductase [Trueperaceae bacterium]|nr:FAD-dependent oxidoreductase [Trueperaceae bacterium]